MSLPAGLPPLVVVAGMLTLSNLVMNLAWYGHLRFKAAPLWLAIGASWAIALVEYALAVPANRLGHQTMSAPQLKGLQEALTLATFLLVSWAVLGQVPTMRQWLGFALMLVAAVLIVGDGTTVGRP
jgi:uncharacterized protein (DUF486 family)